MSAVTRDVRWWELAACTDDPEVMHPPPGDHAATWRALRVCRRCDVVTGCLRDALETRDESGVRGGLTGDDRKRLRQRRSPLLACRCGMPMAPKSPLSKVCRLCAQRATTVVECPECGRGVGVNWGVLARHYPPDEGRVGVAKCAGSGESV